jgi:hypothetical protein
MNVLARTSLKPVRERTLPPSFFSAIEPFLTQGQSPLLRSRDRTAPLEALRGNAIQSARGKG